MYKFLHPCVRCSRNRHQGGHQTYLSSSFTCTFLQRFSIVFLVIILRYFSSTVTAASMTFSTMFICLELLGGAASSFSTRWGAAPELLPVWLRPGTWHSSRGWNLYPCLWESSKGSFKSGQWWRKSCWSNFSDWFPVLLHELWFIVQKGCLRFEIEDTGIERSV